MRIAVGQVKPIKGDIEGNIENHLGWINRAAGNADLIVFPELSLTGYEHELADALSTNQNDKRLDCFQVMSDEHNITIAVGVPTKNEGNLHISMIIFSPFKVRITYSKQYLYPTEVSLFTAGVNPLALKIESDIVAPAICYELSNREHHEVAVKNNATVYMASVLNSVAGVDGDLKKLADIAKTYKMVAVMSNFVGESGGYKCAGKSSVWNDKGELVAQLGGEEEGLIIYDTLSEKVL